MEPEKHMNSLPHFVEVHTTCVMLFVFIYLESNVYLFCTVPFLRLVFYLQGSLTLLYMKSKPLLMQFILIRMFYICSLDWDISVCRCRIPFFFTGSLECMISIMNNTKDGTSREGRGYQSGAPGVNFPQTPPLLVGIVLFNLCFVTIAWIPVPFVWPLYCLTFNWRL
jgi:hypothetical protein